MSNQPSLEAVTLDHLRILLVSLHTRFDGTDARMTDLDERLRAIEHKCVAHQVMDVTRTQAQIKIESNVEDMKDEVSILTKHKNMVVGGALVLSAIAAMVGASFALLWELITAWVKASR